MNRQSVTVTRVRWACRDGYGAGAEWAFSEPPARSRPMALMAFAIAHTALCTNAGIDVVYGGDALRLRLGLIGGAVWKADVVAECAHAPDTGHRLTSVTLWYADGGGEAVGDGEPAVVWTPDQPLHPDLPQEVHQFFRGR